jgi:hypothetical protein
MSPWDSYLIKLKKVVRYDQIQLYLEYNENKTGWNINGSRDHFNAVLLF